MGSAVVMLIILVVGSLLTPFMWASAAAGAFPQYGLYASVGGATVGVLAQGYLTLTLVYAFESAYGGRTTYEPASLYHDLGLMVVGIIFIFIASFGWLWAWTLPLGYGRGAGWFRLPIDTESEPRYDKKAVM